MNEVGNRNVVLYILGSMSLLGILGIYLATSQDQAFSELIRNPFLGGRNLDITAVPTEEVVITDVSPSPTVIIETTEQAQEEGTIVNFNTNQGTFKVTLFDKSAPNTVANFKKLVDSDYYTGVSFHRYIPNLLLQGGSRNTLNDNPDDDSTGGPGYTINHEINWESLGLSEETKKSLSDNGYLSDEGVKSKNLEPYVIAMASNGPNTAGSQFFIVLPGASTGQLEEMEGRYTVFGMVTSGKKVIDELSEMTINLDDLENPRPSKNIVIKKLSIEN